MRKFKSFAQFLEEKLAEGDMPNITIAKDVTGAASKAIQSMHSTDAVKAVAGTSADAQKKLVTKTLDHTRKPVPLNKVGDVLNIKSKQNNQSYDF